jgi:hypothetical protein
MATNTHQGTKTMKAPLETSMNDETASLDEKLQMLQERGKDVSKHLPISVPIHFISDTELLGNTEYLKVKTRKEKANNQGHHYKED